MQIALASVADSGVRVEYVDTRLLGTLIQANPARYGFADTGACSLAGIGNPALQNQFLFYVDGIHLTSHGFARSRRIHRQSSQRTAHLCAAGRSRHDIGDGLRLDLVRQARSVPRDLWICVDHERLRGRHAGSLCQGAAAAGAHRRQSVVFLHARQWRRQRPAGDGRLERLQSRQRRRNDRSGVPQRRRAIPSTVRGQRTDHQPLSQPDGGRRFHRQWPHHPIQCDVGALDRQQLGVPRTARRRTSTPVSRPASWRRCGPMCRSPPMSR